MFPPPPPTQSHLYCQEHKNKDAEKSQRQPECVNKTDSGQNPQLRNIVDSGKKPSFLAVMRRRVLHLLGKEHLYYPDAYITYLKSKGVKIGENLLLMQFSPQTRPIIDFSRPSLVTIGNNVEINANFRLMTHDNVSRLFVDLFGEFIPSSGKVNIGNNVSFAINCTVLKGVSIGDYSFIGANSVVTKDIPPYSIAVGSPAKVVCDIREYFDKRKEAFVGEVFAYARSIKERFGRMPVPSDFCEEFTLFVDKRNIDQYPEIPIRQQLRHQYDRWLETHVAPYEGLDAFLAATFSNDK